MQVDFYHLTLQPLDRVLPRIAERVVAGGDRLLIVAESAAQRTAIDKLLWTYTPDSFLPHAQAGTGDTARQPVLIAADPEPANGARHVAFVDGMWRDEGLTFTRAFHFFDDERIVEARAAWRSLNDREGIERRYWKQDDGGKWQQVA